MFKKAVVIPSCFQDSDTAMTSGFCSTASNLSSSILFIKLLALVWRTVTGRWWSSDFWFSLTGRSGCWESDWSGGRRRVWEEWVGGLTGGCCGRVSAFLPFQPWISRVFAIFKLPGGPTALHRNSPESSVRSLVTAFALLTWSQIPLSCSCWCLVRSGLIVTFVEGWIC